MLFQSCPLYFLSISLRMIAFLIFIFPFLFLLLFVSLFSIVHLYIITIFYLDHFSTFKCLNIFLVSFIWIIPFPSRYHRYLLRSHLVLLHSEYPIIFLKTFNLFLYLKIKLCFLLFFPYFSYILIKIKFALILFEFYLFPFF